MGIDPMTHKPRTTALVGSAHGRNQDDGVNANLNHIAQWESARVEAEARLVKESKLLSSKYPYKFQPHHHPHHSPIPFPPSKQPMLPCLDILKAWQGVVWTNQNNNNNAGTLQSPTSVLHVSDNMLITTAGGANTCNTLPTFSSNSATSGLGLDNLRTTDIKTKKNYYDPQNNDHDLMLLHGIINDGSFSVDELPPCIPAGAAGISDDHELLPSFPEGVVVTADDQDLLLSDDVEGIFSAMTGLYVDGSSSSGGNLEDNNKYWNY